MKKQEQLQKLDELLKYSELTDEDIERMSKEARKGRYKELQKRNLV